MRLGWESKKQKLLRTVKISAQKKLEWLYQMHQFVLRTMTPKQKKIFFILRQKRKAAL